ncbi:MAG: beta-ketoacyl-ACP synthase II [Fidelibacterota bacterium]|nr:MAG: beta-ketoacyl-ACP synthase II [Candidatus Neomarinimicrobiota bacterium]
MRRIVITGMGAVTPIGNTVDEFEAGLFSGRNGIDHITRFDTGDYGVHLAGEVRDLDAEAYMNRQQIRKMDLFTIYAMIAADQAISQSGFLEHADPNRAGVIIGSGIGGIEALERSHRILMENGPRKVSPFFIPMLIADIAAGQVSIHYGLKGPNYCVISACATASHSLGDAFRLIRYGDADVIVAGGCEASITPLSLAGFTNMKALSRNPDPDTACRPFDAERDGFVMSEGAGILVLEELEHAERRGADIFGELVGYGATADAYHITAPAEGGEGAARAMERAIKDADIDPVEIGYINAHGTSTPYNDKSETEAIKTVFGDHAKSGMLVSSTKSMTGHMLGASGGVEAITTLLALQRQEAPPTIHYVTPDPECDLSYSPNSVTPHSFQYAMSNTFGFGGHNAVLLFKRFIA